MHEVFAEQALADALLQILMRCGDDADIGSQRRMTAHAIVLAVREHAQQPNLKIGRHVADLV